MTFGDLTLSIYKDVEAEIVRWNEPLKGYAKRLLIILAQNF